MLTRASCAKAVVEANAANRAAIKVIRCRYPNCFIVTLLVVGRIKCIPTVFCGPHLVCRSVEGTHHERFMNHARVTADKFRVPAGLLCNVFLIEESWR